MKFLRYLAIALFLFVVIAGLSSLMLPDSHHIERQIVIDASAAEIFPYVNNLKNYKQWSPWTTSDSDSIYTYDGPESGVGAKMAWSSKNNTANSGYQEIVESEPDSSVRILLKFGKNDLSMGSFTLNESAGKTTVVWSFDINFTSTVSRYLGLSMDSWVGDAYEQGLAKLKAMVETQ